MRIEALAAVCTLGLCVACGGDDEGSSSSTGQVNVQISGEELATDGFAFPTGSEVTIRDGWAITFSHVLVTVGGVRLSKGPDTSPTDQSQVGATVKELTGPWAIDLAKEGSATGAAGEGTAVPIGTLTGLTPGERYAFSYDTVVAAAAAERVNFSDDAEAGALYDKAVQKGYSVVLAGTATFKGDPTCKSSSTTYDFAKFPSEVPFEVGLAIPSSYLNCQNEGNQGDPFPGEEFQRGVSISKNAPALAQMTFHVDHSLYSDVEHEPALYFGQMAARLVGKPAGTVLTVDDLIGVDPTSFTDGLGAAVPWRVCDPEPLPAGDTMGFEVGSVPVDPQGQPSQALRDYRDYVSYVTSTQGHMNGGEGLCFTKRNYPSPP